MPIHEEKPWSPGRAALLLVLAFLAIYWPLQLGDRELRWREGIRGAMVQEMVLGLPVATAHGEVIAGEYPLYPWLTALLYRGGRSLGLPLSIEFSLRFVTVLALASITGMVAVAGWRAAGGTVGAVSAATCCAMLLPIEKAIEGYPEMTATACLFAGWMVWFSSGVVRGRWGQAWLVALSCCGLAFYAMGWMAILMFALPLLWMRRPMSIWNRRPPWLGLTGGLLILFGLILLWGLPRWWTGAEVFRQFRIAPGTFSSGYLVQLGSFPVASALRFLPWSILAWPAFCAAYDPLSPNPLFSRFLKTIFFSLAIFMWLNPYFGSRDLLVLVPSLALLTGHHYALLIRRHGPQLHQGIRHLAGVGVVGAAGVMLFYVVPLELWRDLPISLKLDFREPCRWPGLALAGVALGLFTYLVARPGRQPVWVHLLGACAASMLLYWALLDPYRAQNRDKERFGAEVRNHLLDDLAMPRTAPLPPDLVVYKGPGTAGLYNEGCYLGCAIRRLNRYQDLPVKVEEVYVLCQEEDVPAHPERQWGTPLMITNYSGQRMYLYKGRRGRVGGELTP